VLFVSFSCWSQNFAIVDKLPEENDIIFSEAAYNQILNYTPKAFVSDTESRPNNKVLMGDLNTIRSLELRYAYQGQLKLNSKEIQWLEDEINHLAIAFFTEGKPIMLKKAGEYGNCNGQGISSQLLNDVPVMMLHFCYVYPGAEAFENRFLEIFNKRTEKLIAARK